MAAVATFLPAVMVPRAAVAAAVTVVEVVEEAVVAALRLDCLDDMVAGACDPVS